MSDPDYVIRVQRLSKRYALGAQGESFTQSAWKALRRSLTRQSPASKSRFHMALDNVSFDISQGERVAIIGRNGAGKSTLLKILSRVVYPTAGEARIRGRVTSLLELGTGFNEELTGRENIYLNASLHGLTRREVDKRLDDIIEFSEIPRFIDTPVKHYSSGMRMRLAFSVAAHLDPDILMLDEVLAVGDAGFQRKCLARVGDLTAAGHTILFVSHSMESVSRFCDRCLWLERGRIEADGSVEEVTAAYMRRLYNLNSAASAGSSTPHSGEPKTEEEKLQPDPTPNSTAPEQQPSAECADAACLMSAQVINDLDEETLCFRASSPIFVRIRYRISQRGYYVPAVALEDSDNNTIFWSVPSTSETNFILDPGVYASKVEIPAHLLNVSSYFITIALVDPNDAPMKRYFSFPRALSFQVLDVEAGAPSSRGILPRTFPGTLRPLLRWHTDVEQPTMARERVG